MDQAISRWWGRRPVYSRSVQHLLRQGYPRSYIKDTLGLNSNQVSHGACAAGLHGVGVEGQVRGRIGQTLNRERDNAIRSRIRDGASMQELVQEFELSVGRLREIAGDVWRLMHPRDKKARIMVKLQQGQKPSEIADAELKRSYAEVIQWELRRAGILERPSKGAR